ncbi:hypothetical protein B566_EDAN019201, partial [Ephemera danica]
MWTRAQEAVPVVQSLPIVPFGAAFELSIIMPLSWVPLVADYACKARSARSACLAPALGYLGGSLWMYLLGFAGALLTGKADPTPMLLAAGLGLAALGVLVLTTVTTTFLDVYSAVASARNIAPELSAQKGSIVVVALGAGAALVWDSSVADFRHKAFSVPSLVSLGIGIAGYTIFSLTNFPTGPTVGCLVLTMLTQAIARIGVSLISVSLQSIMQGSHALSGLDVGRVFLAKITFAVTADKAEMEIGLPQERLYATIYEDDDEAGELWLKHTGIPKERILRMGEKDNFWSMGDTGPCGPCSEILFDQGEHMSCGPHCGIGKCDCDRFLEIWNLVFMQFNQIEPGRREPLPKPSIDTGMGLERIAAVCQGVYSNYDGDLLRQIIHHAAELA